MLRDDCSVDYGDACQTVTEWGWRFPVGVVVVLLAVLLVIKHAPPFDGDQD